MCCDGWNDLAHADEKCPDCMEPTVKGEAAVGCFWSPVVCKTCGWRPCDNSC